MAALIVAGSHRYGPRRQGDANVQQETPVTPNWVANGQQTRSRRDQGPFPTPFGPEADTRLCHPDELGPGQSPEVRAGGRLQVWGPDQGANCRPGRCSPVGELGCAPGSPAGPLRCGALFVRGRGPKTDGSGDRRGRAWTHTHGVSAGHRPSTGAGSVVLMAGDGGWGCGLLVVGLVRWAVGCVVSSLRSRRRFTRFGPAGLPRFPQNSSYSLAWTPVNRVQCQS